MPSGVGLSFEEHPEACLAQRRKDFGWEVTSVFWVFWEETHLSQVGHIAGDPAQQPHV